MPFCTTVTTHPAVMWKLAEVGLCNIHAHSSAVRVFTVWFSSRLWSWCRTCEVITALIMIRLVPWLAFFRCLTFVIKTHNISDLVTSTTWPGALQKWTGKWNSWHHSEGKLNFCRSRRVVSESVSVFQTFLKEQQRHLFLLVGWMIW